MVICDLCNKEIKDRRGEVMHYECVHKIRKIRKKYPLDKNKLQSYDRLMKEYMWEKEYKELKDIIE